MVYLVTTQTELFEASEYKIIGVKESLDILDPMQVIGVDTETSGLNCHSDKLLSIQLGNYDDQIVVDCSSVSIQHYKGILEDKNKLLLFWNAKFDLKFLYSNKIIPYNVYDGYLAEKLMWLGYPAGYHSMSLKSASEEYLGIYRDKTIRGKIIWNGFKSVDTVIYAAEDVQYLEKIKEKQDELLKEKGLSIAIQYENKFVLALAYEEWCGVKVDLDKWKAKMDKDNARLDKAKKALDEWLINNLEDKLLRKKYIFIDRQGSIWDGYNLDPQVSLNWNSAKQVIPILKLYGVNVETQDKEKGGTKDSIDAKVLKPQKDKCSLIPLLLDYKEAIKVTSTYGENFLKQIDKTTSRLYSQFQQLGADTTRITSGGKDKIAKVEYINLLNLPRDSETRACFCAEEGNKWISMDYSGQESALLASIANDPLMLKELNEGEGDIHSLVASLVFKEELNNVPLNQIKKVSKESAHNGGIDYRQTAKGYEFLVAYGGDANTIMSNYGKTKEEANLIYNSYMDGLSGVKKYQDFCRKDVMEKGYILLNPLTGHKAFIYDFDELQRIKSRFNKEFWDYYREMKVKSPTCDTVQDVRNFFKRKSAAEKQSINYRIQGTGSLCLRVSMINFFEYLRRNGLLFKVLITITPYDKILL